MKNPELIVWLQGYLELCPDDHIDGKKLRIIRNHLNLVKAVEGHLSEHNQKIYQLVSDALSGSDPSDLSYTRSQITSVIHELIAQNFPESSYTEIE